MTTVDLPAPPRSMRSRPPSWVGRVRSTPQWWRDTSAAALWVLVLAVVALWVSSGGVTELSTSTGSALTSLGRVTGLVASALLLVQVFLMARVPWFERAWGQDQLARTHRWVGFTSFNLMLAHIVLITAGYAAAGPLGLWGTITDLVTNYPGMLLAVAGTLALVMVVVTSLQRARAALRYESWHLIHLYAYLGAGLALPHQLWTGADFASSSIATVFWWALYAVALGAVVVYRVAVPAWKSLRYPLFVVAVHREAHDVVSVVMGGRGARKLKAQAGQFFNWRFLRGRGWSTANPYSLSAAPNGVTLRFTAAEVGDGSRALASLRPGTRVLVEGPYGRMHPGVRQQPKVLLMGSGMGIAPMRALLEGLPQQPGEVTIVQRVGDRSEVPLGAEINDLAAQRGARYVIVEGHRIPGRVSWLPQQAAALSDAEALVQLCPDVADRDVYICGAPEWMHAVADAARRVGVPNDRIHLEYFSY